MHKYNEFLPRNGYKIIHDFVVHYDASKDVFEEKALIYTTLREIKENMKLLLHNIHLTMIFTMLRN